MGRMVAAGGGFRKVIAGQSPHLAGESPGRDIAPRWTGHRFTDAKDRLLHGRRHQTRAKVHQP